LKMSILRRRGPWLALERRLGYRFRRQELLERALTHRSYSNERSLAHNNERLEFLGDSVLGLIVVEWLFREHPEVDEGELSKLKAHLVSERVLARVARSVGLGEHLLLGVGEDRSGGRDKSSILADSMEAVIGAAFLDGGLKAAARLVAPMTEPAAGGSTDGAVDDAKSRLQEAVQARGWALPRYRLVEERGPDHQKVFRVECLVKGRPLGSGEGRSKKAAERDAAAEALRVVEQQGV